MLQSDNLCGLPVPSTVCDDVISVFCFITISLVQTFFYIFC